MVLVMRAEAIIDAVWHAVACAWFFFAMIALIWIRLGTKK